MMPEKRAVLAAKRVGDVVVSLSIVLLGFPFWACVAVLVGATSPGPVLFRQERSGRDGRPCTI